MICFRFQWHRSWASCQIRKKMRLAHAPGMPGTFSPTPRVSDPDIHNGTCVTHVPWCMSGSLTSGFLWSRWRGNRSRHSRRMRNPQFYVFGKRPMVVLLAIKRFTIDTRCDDKYMYARQIGNHAHIYWDALYLLTYWGGVPHICVSKVTLVQTMTWRREPSHCLNQCCNIVDWILRNKLLWNLNQNSNTFILENEFQNVVWNMMAILSRTQSINMQLPLSLICSFGQLYRCFLLQDLSYSSTAVLC